MTRLVPLSATIELRGHGLRPCHCPCDEPPCRGLSALTPFLYWLLLLVGQAPVCGPCTAHRGAS